MSVGGKDKKRGDNVASPRSAKQIREEVSKTKQAEATDEVLNFVKSLEGLFLKEDKIRVEVEEKPLKKDLN